jgi:WD40 repeat protein
MSRSSVFQVEVIGDIEQEVNAGDMTKEVQAIASLDWVTIANETAVFQFHAASVHSLSLSARTNMLLSSSRTDGSVRVWDFNRPSSYHGSRVCESFLDRETELPSQVWYLLNPLLYDTYLTLFYMTPTY